MVWSAHKDDKGCVSQAAAFHWPGLLCWTRWDMVLYSRIGSMLSSWMYSSVISKAPTWTVMEVLAAAEHCWGDSHRALFCTLQSWPAWHTAGPRCSSHLGLPWGAVGWGRVGRLSIVLITSPFLEERAKTCKWQIVYLPQTWLELNETQKLHLLRRYHFSDFI